MQVEAAGRFKKRLPAMKSLCENDVMTNKKPFFFLSYFGRNKTALMGVGNNFIVSRLTSPDVFWRIWIVFSLALALVLRLYWLFHKFPVLNGEECEYLRLAENLIRLHTYVGLFEGPQVMYPPLLPFLIAVVSPLTRTVETAGEVVTLFSGMLLVFEVFILVRYIYGTRIGVIAVTIASCHPVLISLSGTVISESLYLPLMVGGVIFGLRCLDTKGLSSALICGSSFGLAYLTRSEAFAYPFVIIVVVVLTARLRGTFTGEGLQKSCMILIPFVAASIPYVAYVSVHTGGLRLEGKSVMNVAIAERINSGMSEHEAVFGVGRDLQEEGPWLSPNQWVLNAPPAVPVISLMKEWIASASRNRHNFYRLVLSANFGAELMPVLVILGLFGRPWNRRRILHEAVLLSMCFLYGFILLGQHFMFTRFFVPFLPFLLAWASNGIHVETCWLMETLKSLVGHRIRADEWVAIGNGILLIVALLLLAGRAFSPAGAFGDDSPPQVFLKEAGIWLAQNRPGPKKIMSHTNVVPYYGGGTALIFPFADPAVTLQYIRAKHPDFLVLMRAPPYAEGLYRGWFDHGIPDQAARLIYSVGPTSDPQAAIYQWQPIE